MKKKWGVNEESNEESNESMRSQMRSQMSQWGVNYCQPLSTEISTIVNHCKPLSIKMETIVNHCQPEQWYCDAQWNKDVSLIFFELCHWNCRLGDAGLKSGVKCQLLMANIYKYQMTNIICRKKQASKTKRTTISSNMAIQALHEDFMWGESQNSKFERLASRQSEAKGVGGSNLSAGLKPILYQRSDHGCGEGSSFSLGLKLSLRASNFDSLLRTPLREFLFIQLDWLWIILTGFL